MEDNEKHFLIEIFKEIGAHIRTTEQKSLMVTGAYIGLFSIFLSNLINSCLGLSQLNFSWLAVAIQFFSYLWELVFILCSNGIGLGKNITWMFH